MIAIIDYGLGNIRAFSNVYKRLNIPFMIATCQEDLKKASKLILPGVGAFDQAMTLLQKSGMRDLLDKLVLHEKVPVLGICVGMQILGKSSEEGKLSGLGWIDGVVRKLDIGGLKHATRLPHMGWNTIEPLLNDPLFEQIGSGFRFYFLHSYYFNCTRKENCLAVAEYGQTFPCAVKSENIYGVQFHPEKSHHNGVQLLKNFGTF